MYSIEQRLRAPALRWLRGTAQRGFTLIELMIVVTIVAILSIVAVTSYRYYARRAYAQEARQLLLELKTKQETYFSEYGQYVSSSTGVSNADFYPTAHPSGSGSGNAEPWDWGTLNCVSPSGTKDTGFCHLAYKPTGNTYFQIVTNGWGPTNQPSSLATGYPFIDNMDLTKRWYYGIARRDADEDGTFATFIVTSQSNEIVAIDELE